MQEKEAGTNFILLYQLRNKVGQFKKAYLQRPIKILHFLTSARIQKCLIELQIFFSFFNNKPSAS